MVDSYLIFYRRFRRFCKFRELERPSLVWRHVRYDQLSALCWWGIFLFQSYAIEFSWKIGDPHRSPRMGLWTSWFCTDSCPCFCQAIFSIGRFWVVLVCGQDWHRTCNLAPTWLDINCYWMPVIGQFLNLQNWVSWRVASHRHMALGCSASWQYWKIPKSMSLSPFCGTHPCEDARAFCWYSFRSNWFILRIKLEGLCLCYKFWQCHPTLWACLSSWQGLRAFYKSSSL